MMKTRGLVAAVTVALGLAAGGCASDSLFGGSQETTSALPPKPKVDPACVTLASQIDTLRREGVAERLAEAAKGKGTTVSVKRDSLAKVAELNRYNAEYQAKCGTVAPAPVSAQPATAPAAAKASKAVSSAPPAVQKASKAAAPVAPTTAGSTEVPKTVAGTPKTE